MAVFDASAHASYRTETARYVQVVGDFRVGADLGVMIRRESKP